jgi:hypothetical protein
MVTIAYAVVMGVLSWVRHVLTWKEDAARLDAADQPTPFFQWEVGFANGAFALAGLLAVAFDWGVGAMAAVVLGYAMYLLQAGLLNGRPLLQRPEPNPGPPEGKLHRQLGACRHGRRRRLLGIVGRRPRTVLGESRLRPRVLLRAAGHRSVAPWAD